MGALAQQGADVDPDSLFRRIAALESLSQTPNLGSAGTITFLGDSRVAQGGGTVTGSAINKLWALPFHVGNALMGQRMVDIGNFGNSGDRSDQVLARLPLALAQRSKFLWIQCGTNDIFQGAGGVNDAGIFANILVMVQAALAQGTIPILVTETGSTAYGGVAAKVGFTHALNQRMRELASVNPNVLLFDLANLVSDPNSASLGFRTNYSIDGQHLSNLGAFVAGQAFQTLMAPLVPATQIELVSASDIYANGARQLIDDPMFLAPTGGAAGAGITGTVPSQWNATRTGAATAVGSNTANASGYGNDVSLACTFSAAGEQINMATVANLGARVSAGDILQFVAEVTVASPSNIKGIAIQLSSQVGGTSYVPWDGYNSSNGVGPGTGYTVTLATRPCQVPSGAISFIVPIITMEANAAGSGTMTIRRVKCIKRFTA